MMTKTQLLSDDAPEGGSNAEQPYRVTCGIITCNICGAIIRNEFEIRGHLKMHSNRLS